MRIDRNRPPNTFLKQKARDGMVHRSEQSFAPEMSAHHKVQLHGRQKEDFFESIRTILSSRVIIIEGISGSGKDTLQTYLKKKLSHRVVYDYSEGEVLHSWKQFQIEGIFELRVKFMKLFVNYVSDIVNRDANAVFLLNRFHLSTYAWTRIQQRKLGKEYDDIINVLRSLAAHVFILQVDEKDIENRSRHPERSTAWQKFQQLVVDKYTFQDRLKSQQKLILEAARSQQIPYSVIKLAAHELKFRDSTIHI